MRAVPEITVEQRADAIAKALLIRKQRSELKSRLKRGELSFLEVIRNDEYAAVVAKMKVYDLVRSLPGIGTVRAREFMERLGIAESRRVRGLGTLQRAELEKEFTE